MDNPDLKRFIEESQIAKIRGNFLSLLMKAQKNLQGNREDFLRKIAHEMETAGDLSFPQEGRKEFEEDKKRQGEEIKKEISELEDIHREINELFDYFTDYLNKVEGYRFDETEGFFWYNDKNKPLNYSHVEAILSLGFDTEKIKEFDQQIRQLSKVLDDQESYRAISQQTTYLHQYLSMFIKSLETIKGQHEKHAESLKDPGFAKKLNEFVNLIRQILTELKQHVGRLVNQLESQLKTHNTNLQTTHDSLEGTKNAVHTHIKDQDKKRILMLTHEFATRHAGGVQTVVQNLTRNLIKDGFVVDVIERSIQQPHTNQFFYYLDSGKHPTYQFSDMSNFFNTFPSLTLGLLHLQSINFAAGKNGWHNGGLDELKHMYPSIPVLCTIHSMVRHEATLYDADWHTYSIECQDETIRESDHFIVLHEFGRQKLQEYHRIPDEKITIIPNGIELHSRFIEKLAGVKELTTRIFNQKKTLLYVGRISREKGVLEMVGALPLIRQKHDAHLVIVGPYHPEFDAFHDEIRKAINQQGVERHITFAGKIPPEQQCEKVYEAYKPDIALMPSHHESFPMFALEAISHGVPLIVSDVDGPRHVYSPFRQDTSPDNERSATQHIDNPPPGITRPLAIACDPKSPESIDQAVDWIITNPDKVHTILKNAMQEIHDKYTWKRVSQETGKLYKALLEGRSYVSQYSSHDILIDLRQERGKSLHDAKIGLIGHFRNKDGSISDGVARYDETIFSYLRGRAYNVEGYAFVGAARDSDGVVHFSKADKLGQLILSSDMQVALFHGAEEHLRTSLVACRNKDIPFVLCMPYWGAWRGVYELASQVDVLITPLRDYSTKIQAKSRQDVIYIPFPIDTSYWKRVKSDYARRLVPEFADSFIVGYVGRLGTSKNIHLILEPFKEYVVNQNLNIRLLICGSAEGDRGQLLRREIERLGLASYVRFIERAFSSDEVRNLYNSFNAFIFPSSFEPYGLSNLEAISCETPTVVPISDSFAHYAVPSMVNLPGYPFGFGAGHLYDEHGNLKRDGVNHEWQECFKIVRLIYEDEEKARSEMKNWSSFINQTMSVPAVGKEIEKALELAYLKKRI
ncbi:MAG: glycosyltransferase [Nanobdellota archaeon]